MEARAEHADHDHHAIPTEGVALTAVAVSATLHCLTGCAIGEVTGVAVGTALGFSDAATIALAVILAFVFGYALTSLPLLRAGLALSVVIPIALASDTLSIATMEIVDNAIILLVPGAMDSGLGSFLFWGSLAFALAIAFVLTVPVNRWLLARGKGQTAVHETGIHGGPPTKVVGAAVNRRLRLRHLRARRRGARRRRAGRSRDAGRARRSAVDLSRRRCRPRGRRPGRHPTPPAVRRRSTDSC